MENIANVVWTGPWWKNAGIRKLNFFISLAILTSAINGFDSSVLNGMQILPEWHEHFNYPKGATLGMMNAAQNFGQLIGLPFAPLSSDKIGRRKTLFIGAVIMLGGVALQAMSSRVSHFITSRLLIGLGIGFASNASPLLVTELAYPTQRGPITAMYNSAWYLGSIISAWATFATLKTMSGTSWAWRIPCLIQAVPSLIQAILVWFMPESPRYLVAQGRDAEALEILSKYHADGRERDPLVHFTYGQIREALAIEREISQTTSVLTLFKTPGHRRRMRIILAIGFFSQWSGNGLVSYYINPVLDRVGITNPGTQSIINASLQMWNFGVAMSAAVLVDRLGRRPLFITSNSGMLVCFSMWTLTTALWQTQQNHAAASATIALIACFFSCYSMAYTPMLVAYTLEILPYGVRARGFALLNLTICIGITTNQFVNPVALDAINWKYYIVYCCWLVFELVWIVSFVVETKGKTLEETAAIFDGEGHTENLAHIGHDAATQSQHISFRSGVGVGGQGYNNYNNNHNHNHNHTYPSRGGGVGGGGAAEKSEELEMTLSRRHSAVHTLNSESRAYSISGAESEADEFSRDVKAYQVPEKW